MKLDYASIFGCSALTILYLMAGCEHDNQSVGGPVSPGVEDSRSDSEEESDSMSAWSFTDATEQAGINFTHAYTDNPASKRGHEVMLGGIAAGDYDDDGFVDLYLVGGNVQANVLLRNLGDGTFSDETNRAGVGLEASYSSGPVFVHVNRDRSLDLLVNGFNYTTPRLFAGQGDGTFDEVTAQSGLSVTKRVTVGASFADYDRDGDLDGFLSHWGSIVEDQQSTEHLWRNDGNGHFTDVSVDSGISWSYPIASNVAGHDNIYDFTFTPNFSDIDNDTWPDLLIASDFGTTRIFRNNSGLSFTDVTDSVISDENGMGAAVGDYDNDGDMDWFISSIWDPDGTIEEPQNWGVSGNRLYRNRGDGTFEDVTTESGVRRGYWGWGSCFADFNNDGHLDIFHVNGFRFLANDEFGEDPSRMFVSQGDGTFVERSRELGIDDTKQGRGIVCFDYDRDGDVDIVVMNNEQTASLYRNDLESDNRYVTVRLKGKSGNPRGIGARVTLVNSAGSQVREIRAGNNYVSQNPAEAHFGLGRNTLVSIVVDWPDGASTVSISAPNRVAVINHPMAESP